VGPIAPAPVGPEPGPTDKKRKEKEDREFLVFLPKTSPVGKVGFFGIGFLSPSIWAYLHYIT
jgi:hypothetical protein